MSVKVAVRVRPFNSRERKLGCKCIIDMNDPQTIMLPYQNEEERRFTFDFSFWSFDQYKEQEDGYLQKTSPKYADQKEVFEKIGKNILDNAWEGYHCCLFAYGQTGSGKSYSMIGYGVNKGIVPITCNQIFERTKAKTDKEYEIYASMLEIYNEEIQDLTIPISDRVSKGLKIRQNKLLGTYVQGIKKHRVTSFKEIENVMESGTKNRTVAATQMNATSSRAHTIITVEFKQIEKVGKSKSEKISMINLVDLAGSERQDKTGASGQRLKQAVGINQSLTALGQVISILAENSEGKSNFVPYRNSALTRILQNALGGNSQTIMICAISPASDNYDESLSTLRYADRAKRIKNKPVVNESESDKMIRQLKEENERLKALLEGKGGVNANGQVSAENGPKKQEGEDDGDDEESANATILELQKLIEEMKKNESEKKEDAKNDQKELLDRNQINNAQFLLDVEKEKGKLPPYLENISKDVMINRKLKVLLEKDLITIGRVGCVPPNDLIFGGRDVVMKHATINIIEGKVFLKPCSPGAHLYVNGKAVTETTELANLDRVIFGWNSCYLFKNKYDNRSDQKINDKQITWDFVREEMSDVVDIEMSDTEDQGSCCRVF